MTPLYGPRSIVRFDRFTQPIDRESVIFWCELAHALISDKRRKGASRHKHWHCADIRYNLRQAEKRARFLPELSPERIWLDLAREYAPPCVLAITCSRPNYRRPPVIANLGDELSGLSY